MPNPTPSPDSLPVLLRNAIEDTRTLVRLELAMAKMELRQELSSAKRASIGFAVATTLAIAGIALLLVTIALAFSPTWLPAFVVGGVTLAGSGIAGLLSYKAVPKKPLGEARQRATDEVHMLKEHMV
jgi:hypothetical protein